MSGEWASQPVLNRRLHSGDFLVCSAVLTSGNNFGKMLLWAKMLHLKFPSAWHFNRIQGTYLVPCIDQFWADHQKDILETFQNKELIVLGIFVMYNPVIFEYSFKNFC